MIAIADAIDRIAGDRHRRLSDADKLDVDDVLEAALAWQNGTLPLEAFARVGTLDSPATGRVSPDYTRCVAMLSTPISDPRRAALRRAVGALLAFQGFVLTTHGIFAPAEIPNVPIHAASPERRAA